MNARNSLIMNSSPIADASEARGALRLQPRLGVCQPPPQRQHLSLQQPQRRAWPEFRVSQSDDVVERPSSASAAAASLLALLAATLAALY